MHLCKKCNTYKPFKQMKKRKKAGKVYVTGTCHKCGNMLYPSLDPERDRIRRIRANRILRKNDVAKSIRHDCKQTDKRKGFVNDLEVDFIRDIIKDGCSYCGETETRMTLDRIDNAVGHVKANVVPACRRCNLVRRDMPHEAWKVVAKGMREARELGLFSDWKLFTPGPKRLDITEIDCTIKTAP